MEGLGGEEERWKESLEKVKLDLRTIVSDCLLSAVIVAYLGPFTQSFRNYAINNWTKVMQAYSLNLQPLFSLEKVLGE